MDDALLLAELEAQARTTPAFKRSTPLTASDHQWLGRTHALLKRWNPYDAVSFMVAADSVGNEFSHERSLATVQGTLYRAIEDLRLKVQGKPEGVFGPGAVYDFHRALRDVMQSASTSLFVIDPYMNGKVFDYLIEVPAGVTTRLLTMHKPAAVKAAMATFKQQYPLPVEAREASPLHDRVVFVNGSSCFVLGQSIKDAAVKSPTYLAPLSGDLVADKLAAYETVWASAATI
jgi:hypothetical protein